MSFWLEALNVGRTWRAGRPCLALGALVVSLALAGCSSQEAAPNVVAPTSASPTALSPAELAELRRIELLTWAGTVCQARSQVRAAVLDLPAALLVPPSAGTSVEDQLQSQIDAGLEGITAAMTRLGTVLGQAPIDYQEASDIATEINGKAESFTASRQAAEESLRAVADAGNPVATALALADAATRAQAAFESGVDFLKTVDATTRPVRGELGQAFDQAPGCIDD